MKKSKFAEAQIAFALRQAEQGTRIAEICQKMGVSEATIYNWKKKYGGIIEPFTDKLFNTMIKWFKKW